MALRQQTRGSLGLGTCCKMLSRESLREDKKTKQNKKTIRRTRKMDVYGEKSVIQVGGKWFMNSIAKGRKCPEQLIWKRPGLDAAEGWKGKQPLVLC